MIRLASWLCAVSLLSGCVADRAAVKPDGAGETRVYEVAGMACPGCEGGLCKLVNKLEGVASSRADWEANKLWVSFEPGVEPDDERVFGAIRRANFTPNERRE